MKKNAIELLGIGGAVLGAMLMQGCNTVYSNRANSEDLSLRPQPEMLTPVSVGEVAPVTPAEEEIPYWQQQGKQAEAEVAAPVAGYTDYIVKSGDTLSGIAARYGLRWQDVAAVNPELNPNKVIVGKTIKLPGKIDLGKVVAAKSTKASDATVVNETKSSGTYTVKSGDILGRIANAHGVKVSDLMKANGLANANKIRVGQKLVIPASAKAAPKASDEKKNSATTQKTTSVVKEPSEAAVIPPVPAIEPPAIELPTEDISAPAIPTAALPLVAPPQVDTAPEVAIIPPTEVVVPSEEQIASAATAEFQTIVSDGNDDVFAMAAKWGVGPEEISAANPQLAQYTNSIPPAGIEVKIPVPAAK